jgi:hypothetical protein
MDSELFLGDDGHRPMMIALGVGVIGLVASGLLWAATSMHTDRFLRAYLTAYLLVLGVSLWGLLFCMIQHAVRAGWSVVVRRVCEVLASNLKWLWIFFIPIAVGMFFSDRTHLYEWAIPDVVANDAILQGKAAYLNKGFWLVRAAVFFTVWALLARYYVGQSVAQDASGDVEHTRRMERLAPVGCLLFALTTTFAAVDWIMSLEAHWFSTIYGVYFFAASSAACLSVLILTFVLLQRGGRLRTQITAEHYQDLGKLLFAFGIVFWAYIAFSQFMLIWYANIPEETTFFLIRSVGGWYAVSILLVLGHFLVPFVLLVSRHPKRRPQAIAVAAVWMLVMAFVDFYWLAVPQVPLELLAAAGDHQAFVEAFEHSVLSPTALAQRGMDAQATVTWVEIYGFHPQLADLTLAVGMLGLLAAGTIRTMGRVALMPLNDPRLDESLAFENF